MGEYTPHQRRIIKGYYDNRQEIMLARLGEIVSELYLAESETKCKHLWDRAAKAMEALQVAPRLREHILSERKPEVLAHNLRQWLEAAGRS